MLTYQIDGLIHFRAALSRPSKSLRKRGNVCFHAGNYSEAVGLNQLPRGQGAPITPMHMTLRLNRAACCMKLLSEQTDSLSLHQAVSDCRYVIEHCGGDTKQEAKAQLRLGRALLIWGRHLLGRR